MSDNILARKYRKGEDRKKQLDLIIDEGRAMFSTEPDLSMAKLANRVGLSGASSLYRYVRGKRELWFAIVISDFCDFSDGLEEIINDPNLVCYKEILLELCRYFLRFSRVHFAKFKIMFLTEPPGLVSTTKNEKGPFENSYEPRAFTIMMNMVQKAQVAGEITSQEDPFITTGIIWSFLLGIATSVSPLYAYLGEDFLTSNIPTNTGEDPRVYLHDLAVKKIENLIS